MKQNIIAVDFDGTLCENKWPEIGMPNEAPYHSGLIDTVMDEPYPITMPYMPADRAFKIYTEDFLVDPAKGDYDTVGILYIITPSMDKVAINRYFKEAPNGFAEIDETEYKARKEAAKARMEATDGSK